MEKILNTVMVSISCLVYNHAPYLRQCLDGFVRQKTNFRFEAIVHDDASTDESAAIIREYAEKYPDIIKPIYETVNQYSKHDGSLSKIMIKNQIGKYVAICEGDDYWLDPYKLQKQYDMMEKHPELDMCTHAAFFENAITGIRCGENYHGDKVRILPVRDVIMEEGGFVTTNTLFFRNTLNQNIPPFRMFMDYDYPLQIQGALRGGILYLPEYMSVYHQGVPGSFCNRKKTDKDREDYINNKEHFLSMLDDETDYLYHDVIMARFMLYEITPYNNQIKNIRNLLKYRVGWSSLSIGKKINLLRKCICPQLIRLYHHMFDKG